MLEAEINPAGEVLVEGHHVGELQGFRFTADQSAGGEDAKAVRAAAQKALATEFETRAERFAASANGDLALGSDGVLRWIGAPVATLVSGEDTLKPRAILLADEQLTGPARDRVAARIDRYVAYQVETLLKPLADLKNAEQLSGIARGVAFRLLENLGILNRRDVADDVKSLDQEARAALRRLGVRFGAYHVFLPALLKPGPAGLLTLLWALANDGKDKPGFGDVVNALSTGRTSLVVDPTFEKEFYRLAGYRLLGRRAVRVDILERLADLIRPALAWRPGTGARPDGGYDGAAFVVTPAMMSILGATADDMEEILKGLGYRGEARPAVEVKSKLESLDQAARAAAEAETARRKAAAEAAVVPTAEVAATAPADETDGQPGSLDEVAAAIAVEQAEASAGVGPVEGPLDVAAPEVVEASAEVAEPAATTAAEDHPVLAAEAVSPGQGVGEAAAEASLAAVSELAAPELPAGPVEEEKPIMLWRPGRFGDRQRQDNRGRGRRGQPRDGQPRDGQPRDGQPREGHAARERQQREGQPRQEGQAERPATRPGEGGKGRFENRFKDKGDRPRGDRPDRNGPGGKPERDRGGKGDRNDRGDRRPATFQPKAREERPVKFDPDSPFAKLAALRDQLKK